MLRPLSLCPLLLASLASAQTCPPQDCAGGLAPLAPYTVVASAVFAQGAGSVDVPVYRHYSPSGQAPSKAEVRLTLVASGVLDIHNLDANAPAQVNSIWGAQGALASPVLTSGTLALDATRSFADNLAPNMNTFCTFDGPDAVHHVDPPLFLMLSASSTVTVCVTDPVLLQSLFTTTSVLDTLPFTFNASGVTVVSGGVSLCAPSFTMMRAEVAITYSGCEPATAQNSGSVFCDCTTPAAPCTNAGVPGNGCASSASALGAELRGLGSVAPDALTLRGTSLPASALCVLFQSATAQSALTPFGSGLACLGGAPLRLFASSAASGLVLFPGSGAPALSARSAALGDPIPQGAARHYQILYRDPPPGGCPLSSLATLNASNGYRVVWY